MTKIEQKKRTGRARYNIREPLSPRPIGQPIQTFSQNASHKCHPFRAFEPLASILGKFAFLPSLSLASIVSSASVARSHEHRASARFGSGAGRSGHGVAGD